MRTLLALTALLSTTLTLPGCLPGCGAFNGGQDKVFQHGTEMLIECGNGGYVMRLTDGMREGHLSPDFVADDGPTGALAFTIVTNSDATLQALDRTWTFEQLDQTALDHADVMCTDLETRTWWDATGALPVTTAFAHPAANYPTVAACEAAKAAGNFPNLATCQDELLFCPDGKAVQLTGDAGLIVSYTASFGTIDVFGTTAPFVDGTFDTTWKQVDVATVDISCPS